MAGAKVNNYAQDDTNILELQLTTDKTFKGYHQLTLTNYDNTTVPAIAAGSCIEVNGALYKFDSEEAISTTDPVTSSAVADGTIYICLIPSTTSCTAAFTATAPTWSDSKQGWYGTGGQANYRYVGHVMGKSGSTYYGKTQMLRHNEDTFYYAADVTERTTTSASQIDESNLSVTFPIKKGCVYKIIFLYSCKNSGTTGSGIIYNGLTTTSDIIHLNNYDSVSNTIALNKNDRGGTYTDFAITSYILAQSTTNYTHKMSWKVGSGTLYVSNRKFYVKKTEDLII